ncbi:unnamed protein product [Aphanomyces euteiches]|uniref:FBD domain-containing protein n=1 Tax=Aphanomyces euteiches TaxID=100861 RepID=A0A6G0W967_9STRA|nr:hypothetical protein Ae201684_017503 [Aphanomyces euteiches]KAH9101179.1 hypothetical protein Ae201684P_007364 [Aphanomyces euteiches]KAH9142140.1 hypothetical protein AeRB84_013768 [Aphanomyces euteiches]
MADKPRKKSRGLSSLRAKKFWLDVPLEIVIKITFSIPEAKDVMAFLEALRPHVDLGPLEHLTQLDLANNAGDFWPILRLRPGIPTKLLGHESIVKYFSKAYIENAFDVEWVKKYLHPSVELSWMIMSNFVTMGQVLDRTGLRITSICLMFIKARDSNWMDLLLRFPHLRSLTLHGEPDTLGDLRGLFQYLATKNQITEFNFYSKDSELTADDVVHLIKWFKCQPVRAFQCKCEISSRIDKGLIRKLCRAIFKCHTLDTLGLYGWSLHSMDFSRCNLSMRKLVIAFDDMKSDFIKSLASRLVESRVTSLSLSCGAQHETIDGLEYLLQVLPQTSIEDLTLPYIPCDEDSPWCDLAPLFENCPLKTLALSADKLPSRFVQQFAAAIRNNQTLCELNLRLSQCAVDDLHLLVENMVHPNRRVETKRITSDASYEGVEKGEKAANITKSLKNLAAKGGGVFVRSGYRD